MEHMFKGRFPTFSLATFNDKWIYLSPNTTFEMKMLISYISYQHALKTFEVELSKWEMGMGLMRIEVLHNIILQWEKENG
jgi:hypothetical protein